MVSGLVEVLTVASLVNMSQFSVYSISFCYLFLGNAM